MFFMVLFVSQIMGSIFLFLSGVLPPDDKILFGIAPKSIQKNLEKSSAIWFFLACLVNVMFPAITMCINVAMRFTKLLLHIWHFLWNILHLLKFILCYRNALE